VYSDARRWLQALSTFSILIMEFDSKRTLRRLAVNGSTYDYFSLPAAEELGLAGIARLPYSLKVLLENLLRQNAEGAAGTADVRALVDWLKPGTHDYEIGFRPTRVLMPDSSGIPFLGDMAAMRDATARLGGKAARINPVIPVDFIVDHSVIVDEYGSPTAAAHNMELEFAQNHERYEFLRWASRAFENMRLVPPGNGICHQINLELLARVVWTRSEG
jgi:aconitate hydratase